QTLSGGLDFPPGSGQTRTRRVEQVSIRVHGLIQPTLQRLFRQRTQQLSAEWRQRGNSLEIRVHRTGGSENLEQGDQVNAFKHASLDPKAPENLGDVGDRFGDQSVPPA